jgi:general secretion pathway protein H
MEMVIVIAIIALAAAIVIPRLPVADSARLRTSARSVAAMLRYLGERGATTGTVYRLHLNLTDNSITVMTRGQDGGESPPKDSFLTRRFLAEGVSLADVELSRLGKVATGEVTIDYGPGGLSEYFIIHLKGAGDEFYTLYSYPSGGRVKVEKGHGEMPK